jgi:hypothetical protein
MARYGGHLVIKSVFVRGETDENGNIQVRIDSNDADLSQGRWQMSLDSVIVTHNYKLTTDIPVCVSANHSYFHFCDGGQYKTICLPARQLLFVLRGLYRGVPDLITENRKEWLDVQHPASNFQLMFQNAETDAPLRLKLQLIVLLKRLS